MTRRTRCVFLLVVLVVGMPALAGALGLVASRAAGGLAHGHEPKTSFVVRVWTLRTQTPAPIRRLARAGAAGAPLAESGDAFDRLISQTPDLQSSIDVITVSDAGEARLQTASEASVATPPQPLADGSGPGASRRVSYGRLVELSARSASADSAALIIRCESRYLSPTSQDPQSASSATTLELETEIVLPIGGVHIVGARDDAGYLVAVEVQVAR